MNMPISISSLSENEKLVLVNSKDEEIIAFGKGKIPEIFDTLIRNFVDETKGLFIPFFERNKFENEAFILLDDPRFFDAFKAAFPNLNEAHSYHWKIVKY